jgi:hypothetical protein
VHQEWSKNAGLATFNMRSYSSVDEIYEALELKRVHLTVPFVGWVGMHALIPYHPAFSIQHAVYLNNPIQATLFHYLITDLFCYGVERGIASKLPCEKSATANSEDVNYCGKWRQSANGLKISILEYCDKCKPPISIPVFPEYYFQLLPYFEEYDHAEQDGSEETYENGGQQFWPPLFDFGHEATEGNAGEASV